jgi:hypothetical protein
MRPQLKLGYTPVSDMAPSGRSRGRSSTLDSGDPTTHGGNGAKISRAASSRIAAIPAVMIFQVSESESGEGSEFVKSAARFGFAADPCPARNFPGGLRV